MFGPVLIALLVGAIWLDVVLERQTGFPGLIILPILALAVLGAVQEIAPILRSLRTQASRRLLSTCALLGLASCTLLPPTYSPQTSVAIVASIAGLAMFISLLFYTRNKSTQGVVLATGVALICFVYLGLMSGFLYLIRRDFGAWELLAVLLVTKSYDIGAFFTGRPSANTSSSRGSAPAKPGKGSSAAWASRPSSQSEYSSSGDPSPAMTSPSALS